MLSTFVYEPIRWNTHFGWRPLVGQAISAVLDELVLDAFGYPHPTPVTRRRVERGLRLRAHALRYVPRRRRPRLVTAMRHRGYPYGYRVEQLGAAAARETPPAS